MNWRQCAYAWGSGNAAKLNQLYQSAGKAKLIVAVHIDAAPETVAGTDPAPGLGLPLTPIPAARRPARRRVCTAAHVGRAPPARRCLGPATALATVAASWTCPCDRRRCWPRAASADADTAPEADPALPPLLSPIPAFRPRVQLLPDLPLRILSRSPRRSGLFG